jgi:predicted GTPase
MARHNWPISPAPSRPPCDAVVIGTPMDLGRLIDLGHPARRATYEYRDAAGPTLASILEPYVAKWRR